MRYQLGRAPTFLFAALALSMTLSACESHERPNVPFPDVQAIGLDGRVWNRQALAGKPWVINLWVPR